MRATVVLVLVLLLFANFWLSAFDVMPLRWANAIAIVGLALAAVAAVRQSRARPDRLDRL